MHASGGDAKSTLPGVQGISSTVTACNGNVIGVIISDELNSLGWSPSTNVR